MKKVFIVEVENEKVIHTELSKKGYKFYNSSKPQDDLAGHWGEWKEGNPLKRKD